MKNNKKGFASIVLIGAVVALVAIGGYFILSRKSKPTAEQQVASFSIEPSVKKDGWVMYQSGARAVLVAKNVKSAEVRYFSTGTGITDSTSAGQMRKVSTVSSGDTWELVLPKQIMATNFWAETEDMSGNKSKTTDLGNVGFDENTQAQVIPNLEAKSISSAYIYGPELNKVKVYLYAANEKKTIATNGYCGSPKGAEVRTGNYSLIVDPSTATSDNGAASDLEWKSSAFIVGLNNAPISFVKGTAWNGQITVDQLDPTGYKNFIMFQEYGTCNTNYLQVFGYDFSKGSLVQYEFIGPANENIPSGSWPVSSIKKSVSGNLVTSFYDQTTGNLVTTEWIFDASKNLFRAK